MWIESGMMEQKLHVRHFFSKTDAPSNRYSFTNTPFIVFAETRTDCTQFDISKLQVMNC